jgi:hypothetical protein
MQTDGRLCHLTLAFLVVGASTNSRVASLHGRYSASSLLPAQPPPSRLSADFAAGRAGLLQLPGLSLSSCCRYYPAGVVHRIGQISIVHDAFTTSRRARPPRCTFSRPPMRLLSLRPDDSLTIQRMALSIDYQDSVSLLLTIQATGSLTFSVAGLTPAEYASLRWTYPDARPCQYTFCSPCGCSLCAGQNWRGVVNAKVIR